MKKVINQGQIEAIIQAFYDINAPIKLFSSVKDMLEKLPEVNPEGSIPTPPEYMPVMKPEGGEGVVA